MADKIKYLKDSELTQILADGFAELYHNKPQLPVTFLANYHKNYNRTKGAEADLVQKLDKNQAIIGQIRAKEQ